MTSKREAGPMMAAFDAVGLFLEKAVPVLAILVIGAQVVMAINRPVNLPEIAGATRTAIKQFSAPTPTIDDDITEVVDCEIARIECEAACTTPWADYLGFQVDTIRDGRGGYSLVFD